MFVDLLPEIRFAIVFSSCLYGRIVKLPYGLAICSKLASCRSLLFSFSSLSYCTQKKLEAQTIGSQSDVSWVRLVTRHKDPEVWHRLSKCSGPGRNLAHLLVAKRQQRLLVEMDGLIEESIVGFDTSVIKHY